MATTALLAGAGKVAGRVASALDDTATSIWLKFKKNNNPTGSTPSSLVKYTPVNPGPLPDSIANTFRSGTYVESVTSEYTSLYRVYGGNAGELGSYWTRTPPSGPLQSTIDSALNPVWGNTAEKVVQINVPAGVKLYEGVAAPQGGLVGGGSQVVFPPGFKVDPSWVVK